MRVAERRVQEHNQEMTPLGKGVILPFLADARAKELGNAIAAMIGEWNRKAITVDVAKVEDAGGFQTLFAAKSKIRR